jgi:hypothetical protein
MGKNSCAIAEPAHPQESLLQKAVDLSVKLWSGADPTAPAVSAKPRPRPVLHRLPDLRKFGPSLR